MGVHVLNDLECVSKDCVKCHFDTDVSFYVRLSYLEQYNVDAAAPGVELSDEEFADFVQAGSAFAAEKCAVEYLASREHSRYQLRLKLLKKADLVFETRDKNYIYYQLNTSVLEEIMLWISDLKGGGQNAESE